MLYELCREYTELTESDIAILSQIASNIPHICALTDADIFVDCFYQDNSKCLVVAEAHPVGGRSVYEEAVVGKHVLPEKEPAVFRALKTGMPVKDIAGITQENKTVRQVVVPIRNDDGRIIGALIQEKDISESVSRDKKYEKLAQINEQQREMLHRFNDGDTAFMPTVDDNKLAMKEIQHRVKNNLQLVASMLSLQARNTAVPEIRDAFRENVSRISSFASVFDILAQDEPGKEVLLLPILDKVCDVVMTCSTGGECNIAIRVEGDSFHVDSDKASCIALVVNELVMNAVKHAFRGRAEGVIQVTAKRGKRYSMVTVMDNGNGFPAVVEKSTSGIGMKIVNSVIHEKLKGNLRIESGDGGSCVIFEFRE